MNKEVLVMVYHTCPTQAASLALYATTEPVVKLGRLALEVERQYWPFRPDYAVRLFPWKSEEDK